MKRPTTQGRAAKPTAPRHEAAASASEPAGGAVVAMGAIDAIDGAPAVAEPPSAAQTAAEARAASGTRDAAADAVVTAAVVTPVAPAAALAKADSEVVTGDAQPASQATDFVQAAARPVETDGSAGTRAPAKARARAAQKRRLDPASPHTTYARQTTPPIEVPAEVPAARPLRAEATALAQYRTRPRDCKPPARLHDDPLDLVAHAGVAMMTGGLSPISAALACIDWGLHLAISPGKCVALGTRALRDAAAAWRPALPMIRRASNAAAAQDAPAARTATAPAGEAATASEATPPAPVASRAEPAAPAVAPDAASADPRFAAPSWSAWPFSAWRDAFLRAQQWWQDATTGVPGVDRHHEDMVRFMARQWIDACSPGNFVATNPVVLETALASGGANFVAGAKHWVEDYADIAKHLGGAPVRAPLAYEPGRNVAITPGQVVWRDDLCELLQYDPLTPRVACEPVFVVPSWIMKYYILDLQPHNSLIRYLVGQGLTVFTLSWHNPDASSRERRLADYLQSLLAALDAVRARCGGEPAHAVGYCLGGTLLAIAAAALARDGHADALRTVSLLAAQTDFTEPGELGLFIDASELAALDALMWRQGYLDGSQMAATFQLLNARDLVWSRMMSEYLLGRRSKANDLMSWNADTTRMPYRMHSEYLNDLFLDNDLADGRYCVDGAPVALSDIQQPMFVVGTERDHVSPWRSVYKLLLYTHNPLTFLLTAGGHNAGIVSEPGHARRHYRCATRERGAPYRSPQAFFDDTPPVEGSWWPRLAAWLHQQSQGEVPARAVTGGLANAPGDYIFER